MSKNENILQRTEKQKTKSAQIFVPESSSFTLKIEAAKRGVGYIEFIENYLTKSASNIKLLNQIYPIK